jgi:GTPase SAR1 family protein
MVFSSFLSPDRSGAPSPPTVPGMAVAADNDDDHQQGGEEAVLVSSSLEGNEKYRSFIDRLSDSNLEKHVSVPMVAVMGDTSTGKSSLLSMLSGIELPSNDQITTKCPIKLHMTPSLDRVTQKALVEVQWKGDDPPINQSEADRFFSPIAIDSSNWDELPNAISKAQQHILSITRTNVAPDMVVVKLESPTCENLTLIDLPGIVRARGKNESATLSEDIQGLITQYLQNPRCVILAVLPSNVDFHNSQILAEARKVDPETRRTIPVLTKPDLIDGGAESSVQDLLLGLKTDSFEKGYHMVKARGQKALNTNKSITEALRMEETFFRTKKPWSEMQEEHSHLFGTKSLRIKLSHILMDMIKASFYDIRNEMEIKRQHAAARLSQLGEVPDSAFAKRISYSQAKDNFLKSLQPTLLGIGVFSATEHQHNTENCSAKYHSISEAYKETLNASELVSIADIAVGVKAVAMNINGDEYSGEVAMIDEDSGSVYLKGIYDGDPVKPTSSTFGQTSPSFGPPQEVYGGVSSTDATRSPSFTSESTAPSPFGRSAGEVWKSGSYVFQLDEDGVARHKLKRFQKELARRDTDWIKALNQKHRTYAVPVFANETVFNSIIADAIDQQWKKPSLEVVVKVSNAVSVSVQKLLKAEASLARFPKLLAFLLRECQKVIDSQTKVVNERVEQFIRCEKIPYTQDDQLFQNIQSQRYELTNILITSKLASEGDKIKTSEATKIVKNAFDKEKSKTLDEFQAFEMANAIGAYGKVAVKRFCDHVPMTCSAGLLHELTDKLNTALTQVSEEQMEKLLSVPEDEFALRTQLKKTIKELEKVIRAFDEEF